MWDYATGIYHARAFYLLFIIGRPPPPPPSRRLLINGAAENKSNLSEGMGSGKLYIYLGTLLYMEAALI